MLILNAYARNFAETIVKVNVYYPLVCFCVFQIKLSSIEGFFFIASWLGVLGNAVCYCLILY